MFVVLFCGDETWPFYQERVGIEIVVCTWLVMILPGKQDFTLICGNSIVH